MPVFGECDAKRKASRRKVDAGFGERDAKTRVLRRKVEAGFDHTRTRGNLAVSCVTEASPERSTFAPDGVQACRQEGSGAELPCTRPSRNLRCFARWQWRRWQMAAPLPVLPTC